MRRGQPDPVRREASRIASLVAVPVALAVVGFGIWSSGALRDAAPTPSGTPTTAPATGPVDVAAPSLSPAAASVCRAVVAGLPDSVLGATRRPVTAGEHQNAAYGDPPILLACGVAPIADLDPVGMVNNLDGVCWFGRIDGAGTVWTTVDREVAVAVTVPGTPDGSAQSVIGFSAAIGAADPVAADIPPGCTG